MNQETNDDAAPEGARAEGEIAGPTLDERLAKTEAELAETRDKLLRALAETENQRRRAGRERDDAQRYAAAAFAKDMLDVADNLHRALASVPGDAAQDERVSGLIEGVAATERALLAALERHGIRRIEPELGERFDFNLHQAMFELESTGYPPGSVVQVMQPGYRMHDRLLRPALVGVAKSAASNSDSSKDDAR